MTDQELKKIITEAAEAAAEATARKFGHVRDTGLPPAELLDIRMKARRDAKGRGKR